MISLFWNHKAATRAAKEIHDRSLDAHPWRNGTDATEKMALEAMNALPPHRWSDVIFRSAPAQAKHMEPAQMRQLGQHLDQMADEMERNAR